MTPEGAVLGALPAVPIATPWWQDIAPVVEAVRAAHGVAITVLRMLAVGELGPSGIEITYLAEAESGAATEPWDGALDSHPLRLSYAKPGGPAADLRWAKSVLRDQGLTPNGPVTQVRTWNLSSLWRIQAADQAVWLKAVPPFFAHEGRLLEVLAGGPVPSLLGHEGSRVLMREIAGEDCYDAAEPLLSRMVDLLVGLQSAWAGRTDELLRLGLPDWRGPALGAAIGEVIARNAAGLTHEDRISLEGFTAGLPERLADLAGCGLPDTLVHGDFHPGNFRRRGETLTLLDWGDSGVGHPLLDQPAFLTRIAEEPVPRLREQWHAAWSPAAPGSDPDRAATLLAPIAAARQAVIYQGFLDRIEPSEHPYHRDDPLDWLGRTASIIRAEQG